MDDASKLPTAGPTDTTTPDLLEQLTERLKQRLPEDQADLAVVFAQQYYANVAAEDMADRSLDDLYGAVLSHWHFARIFSSGTPKLRVYNPKLEEHGWQSTHTVIEMVNDDMPFLVDSITMEVNRLGLTLHLIVHPVMKVLRDDQHHYLGLDEGDDNGGHYESLIHVEVDRRTDPQSLTELRDGLQRILGDVRLAVQDWQAMREKALEVVAALEASRPPVPSAELAEDLAFLRWLADDNFTLLGQRDYDLVDDDGQDALCVVPGSGLGILREVDDGRLCGTSSSFASLPPEVRAQARVARPLLLTKSNARSTVHRPGHLDYVGVKRFDAEGKVVGEWRFLGLYTSVAYNAKAADIPLLRRKVDAVITRAAMLPGGHRAKALAAILEQYPRDELFQIEIDELFDTAMGILRLGERQRTRLFLRRDAFGRFTSCLIYVPRENYNTDIRSRIQKLLTEALNGSSSEFTVQFSDSPLARVLIVVHSKDGKAPIVDVAALEQRLVQFARRWEDELRSALLESCGEERGNALYEHYAAGFTPGYRDDHMPRAAVRDIELMDSLQGPQALAMSLYVPLEEPPGRLRFKLLRSGNLAPLSQSLPMLEHMGVQVLEERPYEVQRRDGEVFSIDDFGMCVPGVEEIDIDNLRGRFQETLARTWRGDNDNDDFNRLVMRAGLDWRAVGVLRAYARYMKQAAFTFSESYIQQALASHPGITADLVALFHARFDPAAHVDSEGDRQAAQDELVARIKLALDDVSNLDEDRIVRQYMAMMLATLRTNYFQRTDDGEFKPVLSFKFDPSKVPDLPEPRPMFEIFVWSPRVEGVHLRGGRVARGGLRWSDRMEDYRTEVLGLVKAQQVKNAVIVPVGSKGGFVLKRPPPPGDREALMKEGIACYQAYLRGLLDITDNLVAGEVVPPKSVVRHDADDTYLVVAADKGTATFSDIANGTAAEYGFWLGDAFASGGSAGYDHKKMGITARGAWESVKRHFRALDHDTQSQDFTVVGVGDMSGDVFGNGMLLSKHIRLLASFDHRHIFIDPEPDAATSFEERQRLFDLPRSSWADYDTEKISAGGGIWPRSAKSIPISPQARSALGLDAEVSQLTPTALMHAILLAPADLFYNGGIGTYIKASSESHAECGDRATDSFRVDGNELRVKVVAEGGNLGATQRGRIEFSQRGGLVNTDAIDNSAGVDCSDHEVNIKIALDAVVADGELTPKQRNKLLADMTDDVAALVLRDNTFQNQVLSVTVGRGVKLVEAQGRYMRHLVQAGRLNRRIEFLPNDTVLADRRQAGQGLSAPELAVLLAYSKMELYDLVLASDVPEDPYIATSLLRYFPRLLQERFSAQIQRHPLKREIIATHVVNSMVNRVGPSFAYRLHEETGASQPDIVRAYLGTREIFDQVNLWLANEALDHQVKVAAQNQVVLASLRLVERGTVWLLHQREALRNMDATIKRYAPGAAQVADGLERWLGEDDKAVLQRDTEHLMGQGVPEALAQRVARLDAQVSALEIVDVALDLNAPVAQVAGVYFGVGGRLQLGWLAHHIGLLPADTHWQGLAKVAMRDDLSALAGSLARSVLRGTPDVGTDDPAARIDAWQAQRSFKWQRCTQLLADLKPTVTLDVPMLSVLLRELRALV